MKYSTKFFIAISITLLISACETAPPVSPAASGTTKALVPAASPSNGTAPTSPAPLSIANTASSSASQVKSVEPVAAVMKVKPEQLLAEGTELYEKGDYRNAIRKLTSARDAADEGSLIKQNSFRYLAFSYCVTSQRALCKAQFSNLLAMSPEFQLSRGESGHPQWGPVFKEAKAALTPKPKR